MRIALAAVPAATSPACRLPGCDGILHADGACSVDLVEVSLGLGYVSLVAAPDGPRLLDVYGDTRAAVTTPGEALALAAKFRAFAAAIEQAAAYLSPLADADTLAHIARTVIENATGGNA